MQRLEALNPIDASFSRSPFKASLLEYFQSFDIMEQKLAKNLVFVFKEGVQELIEVELESRRESSIC